MQCVITFTVPLKFELVSLTPSDHSDHYLLRSGLFGVLTRAFGAGTVKILNLLLISDADYVNRGDQQYAAYCG